MAGEVEGHGVTKIELRVTLGVTDAVGTIEAEGATGATEAAGAIESAGVEVGLEQDKETCITLSPRKEKTRPLATGGMLRSVPINCTGEERKGWLFMTGVSCTWAKLAGQHMVSSPRKGQLFKIFNKTTFFSKGYRSHRRDEPGAEGRPLLAKVVTLKF